MFWYACASTREYVANISSILPMQLQGHPILEDGHPMLEEGHYILG